MTNKHIKYRNILIITYIAIGVFGVNECIDQHFASKNTILLTRRVDIPPDGIKGSANYSPKLHTYFCVCDRNDDLTLEITTETKTIKYIEKDIYHIGVGTWTTPEPPVQFNTCFDISNADYIKSWTLKSTKKHDAVNCAWIFSKRRK